MAVTISVNVQNNAKVEIALIEKLFDEFIKETAAQTGVLESQIRSNVQAMGSLRAMFDQSIQDAKKLGKTVFDVWNNFNHSSPANSQVKYVLEESAKAAKSLAKETKEAGLGIQGLVQRANALNLVPRGYEMTAYRLSGLVQSLGAVAPVLAVIAAGAYSASAAVDRMHEVFLAGKTKKETEELVSFSEAIKEVVVSAGYLAVEMAGPARSSIDDFFDSWHEGLKVLKDSPGEFFRLYSQFQDSMGEMLGIDALKESAASLEEAINEADRVRREDLRKIREAAAQKAILAEDEQNAGKRNIAVLKEQLDATQNLARIESFRADIRKVFLEEASKTENEEVLAKKVAVWKANEAAIEEEINQRRKDRLAIEKEVRQIEAGQAADAAAAARGPRSELQITTEMDFQLRLAKDATQTEKDRQKALEKRKELEKELSEVVKERHRAEKEAERVAREAERERERAEKERLRLLEQERREQERLAEIERRRAEQEFQRFQQEVNRRLGEQGVGGVMDQLDQRRVRENYAKNRVAAESRDFLEQQKRERAAFNERQDELTADGDPYSIRARMQAEAQFRRNQDRARAQFMQRSRAGAFRDFNRGQVDPEELRQAQDQTLGQMVQNGMQQGRISQKTALAMQEQVRALRQQQAQLDEVERAVDEIRAIQGTANRQTKRRAAQGKF